MATNKKLFQKVLGAAKKIREDNESKGQAFEKVDWFIPQDGKVRIRLLPNPKDPDNFFWKEVHTHFMPIKKKNGQMAQIPVRCLSDFDEPCPMCAAYAKLSKSKDAEKADASTRMRPVTRYLVNIIVYDEEKGSAKVQPYAMQSSVFTGVTEIMDELQVVAYDLEEGRDLKLIRKNKNGRTEYQVLPVAASSAVPTKLRPLLKAAVDLDSLYTQNEGERMREYLEIVGIEVEEDEDEEPIKKKGKAVDDDDVVDSDDDEDVDDDDDAEEEDDDADEEEDDEDAEEEASDEEEDEDDDSDDDDDDDDEDEDEEEEESPRERAAKAKAKLKSKAEPVVKKKSKKSDDYGDEPDEDLEKEFEEMGI